MSNYSIKDLEQLSGIKAHTLRIWEQRYKLLCPKRTETNIRYYDDADLKLILNVAMLNAHGIKISKIAAMSKTDISQEIIKLTDQSTDHNDQIQALTICMVEMDEERFEKVLSTNILKLGFEDTVLNIIYPFLSKIGILWQTGAINPAQEHFISNLIRQKLIVAIDGQVNGYSGKTFMLFLPEGELHELSLLFSSYLIKKHGHKVIYLGQSTPQEDLLSVYKLQKPDFLLTIITSAPAGDGVQEYVNWLSHEFSQSEIFVTGLQTLEQPVQIPTNIRLLTYAKEIKQVLLEMEQEIV
ncbi:MerR family transcriptional regulator [Algoriphagus halophytocola]|uniref:MerR family transcriptional regulator n=1 Tax=Algoriphagus halophytocola TaxID=2991499 RepID=A0ABY6MGT9_9BACT|nr:MULTISPECIES: MerR family transcriptional regulator [unclassified Algoriphagus]UZD21622.1 MerR family transcriptional regulator [Algoriphagus sp. TR-M5]WBL42835.1 MerR family transcriptional regulator [Algoriphagus sp. TR-M9]